MVGSILEVGKMTAILLERRQEQSTASSAPWSATQANPSITDEGVRNAGTYAPDPSFDPVESRMNECA